MRILEHTACTARLLYVVTWRSLLATLGACGTSLFARGSAGYASAECNQMEVCVISLLWPDQRGRGNPGRADWEDDVALAPIIRALSGDGRYADRIRAVLTELCPDPVTIVYRQDVLEDLLHLPALVASLEAVLPRLSGLAYSGVGRWDDGGVFQVAQRVAELDLFVECVQGLLAALDAVQPELTAAGWLHVRTALHALADSPVFGALVAELPTLRVQLERASSITIGINLDAQLRPESATLLGIHAERFGGPRSLLGRLLPAGTDAQHGVTPLRSSNERQAFGPDRQLFRDLSHLLEEVTRPVAQALVRYTHLHSSTLAELEGELAFYLGAVRLIRELQAAGYALCRPQIAPLAERVCRVCNAYNLELALRLRTQAPQNGTATEVVSNDITFDESGRIFLLTGPNRGGKTTFTCAVGQVQVLCQAGLYVPGTAARISPVDAIFTLFPEAEQMQTGMGRLDEEAARLARVFREATAHSLVLLNEPLASTNPGEALGIARDVLAGLRLLGVRAVVVTHLHDLVREVAALNAGVAGESVIGSLVAGIAVDDAEQPRRTYRIRAGLPAGQSYAADVAVQHGLHLSQIKRTLQERGLRDRA